MDSKLLIDGESPLEMFVGVIVACMPAASYTFRQLLPYYDTVKSKFHMSRTLPLPHLSSTKTSHNNGHALGGVSVRGRTLVDPSDQKKSSSGHRRYYKNLGDLESILPHSHLQTHIHRGDDTDNLEDGHIHMTYEMQQSVFQEGKGCSL